MHAGHPRGHTEPVRQRVRSGIRWGLYYAVACSAIGLVSAIAAPEALRAKYHVTPLALVALYFLSGVVGGAVFGLLKPIATSLVGAIILGILVAGSAYLPAVLVVEPNIAPFGPRFLFVWGFASVSLGSLCGAYIWYRVYRGS
jgi:hypothetical protein